MLPERHVEILPGFSKRNHEWALDVQSGFEEQSSIDSTIVCWPHWETGNVEEGWIEKEALKITEKVGENTVNILAKSVGTMVAMEVLKQSVKVNKLILCGIPIEDFQEDSKERYRALCCVDINNVVIIQNDKDPHGNVSQVKSLISEFNPNVEIKTKIGNHHEYPYINDFIAFFMKVSSSG